MLSPMGAVMKKEGRKSRATCLGHPPFDYCGHIELFTTAPHH